MREFARRWLLLAITLLIFGPTALSAIVEYIGAETKNNWILAKAVFLVLAAMAGLIQTIIINKNQQNYGDGIQEGHARMQNAWKEVSRRFESAQNASLDIVNCPPDQREAHARMGIDRLLATFGTIVDSVFVDVPRNTLTVTLGIPSADGKKITIAEMVHEADGRRRGGQYDVPDALTSCTSMARAFRERAPIYTTDTRQVPSLRHKRYRSILNFPIVGKDGSIVAILNIDTPIVGAFGPRTPDNAAISTVMALSLPVQRAIAHTLLSTDVYSEYKNI